MPMPPSAAPRHGGHLIAEVLERWGIGQLFTLCGGHISPILAGAEAAGLKVIDCRDERSAVFAADAAARLSGRPGVAAVTAGPGVTNAITALKNAQLAQTPLVLFGGATATLLKGRGALQDIDQAALVASAVKWQARCTKQSDLKPVLERALRRAVTGVPGPVFIEVPVDVLYPESVVREMFMKEAGVNSPTTLTQRALGLYLKGHLYRQFHAPHVSVTEVVPELAVSKSVPKASLQQAAAALKRAKKPALIIGSQTMIGCTDAAPLARAVESLGVPTWLGGGARGLLGPKSPVQFRHARGKALTEADVVVVLGFPFDFRLKYGLGINRKATVISANLSAKELTKNRRPTIAARAHPADFLVALASQLASVPRDCTQWLAQCRTREAQRDDEIRAQASESGPLVDPIHLLLKLDQKLADDSVLVVDGGDFVATAAYVLRPRRPLSWLDPGVFGTLGVGGGFAVGAGALRPHTEVWLLYGDGSSAYSLAEFDTFVRHGMAPIAIVGTDASWAQIARDQSSLLGTSVGTGLLRTAYHTVAEGYGGKGLLLDDPADVDAVLDEAKALSKKGHPVCINVHLKKTAFREGSISI